MTWEVEIEIEIEVEVERFLDFGRNDSFIGEFRFQSIDYRLFNCAGSWDSESGADDGFIGEYRLLGLIQEGVLCVD